MANRQAWSYIRFSTPGQALGDSKRRQLDLAVAYAKRHNLDLSLEPYFDRGVSGFRGKNATEGALAKFLEEVDAKRIPAGSTLLVEALDRITRAEVDHALELFLSIIRRGITIVTLKDEQVYSRERIKQDKGMSLIISLTQLILAHEESAQKASRIRASWDGRRKLAVEAGKLITSRCPPWVKVNEDRTAFVPLADKVKILKRIYKHALEDGWGVQKLARTFNEEGVPRFANAKEWRAQEFVRLLKWEATKGVLVSRDRKTLAETHRIENYYPVIIEPDKWALTQQAMRSRSDRETGSQGRPSERVDNLFSRMFRCGVCGSGVRLTSRDRTNLRCLAAYSGSPNCSTGNYLYEPIEREVLYTILSDEQLDLSPPSGPSIDPTTVLRAELEDKKKQFERWADAFGTSNDEYLVRRQLDKLLSQIKAIEKAIAEAVPPAPVADAFYRSMEVWTELQRTDPEWVAINNKWAMQGAFDEYEEFDPKRRKELREKLQVGLRSLITRVNLLPKLYKTMHPVREDGTRHVRFFKKVEVIGPIVDVLKRSTARKYEFTENGVLIDYTLPSYGSAHYYREKEWEAQQLATLKKKHGIELEPLEEEQKATAPAPDKKSAKTRKRPVTVK